MKLQFCPDLIDREEYGSVISELALTLPLLLVLIIGIIDLGALAQDYGMVEQAAREGVRTSGRLPGLEPLTHISDSDGETLSEATVCNITPGAPLCDHTLVHGRIRHILRNHNNLNLNLPAVRVSSTFVPLPTVAAAAANDDSVAIQVTAPFRGFFLSYDINVTFRGPYLFQRMS